MQKQSENSTGRVEAIREKEKTGLQKGDLEKQAGINRSQACIRPASPDKGGGAPPK
ncbi:MAG: hypothetical protein IE937_06425 [Gammaproteobacteria bacterium]|nr:hypothetical protein [Gammaproteobacteria bacterium]